MGKKLLRKLTTKEIVGGKVDVRKLPQDNSVTPLCTVYGTAMDATVKASQFGDYVLFTGMFRAIPADSEDSFHAGKLILPAVAQDMLHGAVMVNEGAAVEFAFKIGVRYDATSATSYVYVVESVFDHSESTAMAAIESKLGLLAAPAPEPAPAPAPEPAHVAKGKK